MAANIPDSSQGVVGGVAGTESPNKVFLKSVSIDLNKQQRKKSTLYITLEDTIEKKKSEQKKYTNIHWEPQQAWDVTDGGNITVLWKFRCPLQWSRKTRVDISNVLDRFHKGELTIPESGLDGAREYNHTYENKWCKITMKFDVQGNPQPTSLSERLKSAEVDAKTVESIRDRLGTSVTYLEGVLAFGNLVKDIHPVVGSLIGILSTVIKILDVEDAHTKRITGIIVSMSDMVDYVFNVKQFVTVTKLKEAIEEAKDLMGKAVDVFNKHKDRGTLGRLVSAVSPHDQGELEEIETNFAGFKDKFDRGLSVQNTVTLVHLKEQVQNLIQDNGDNKVLKVLDTKHQTRALRCTDGTRDNLISFILNWLRDHSEDARNILRIYGYPGVGKSTLIMHTANLLVKHASHRLVIIFEFNRTTATTAITLWKTIAYELACEYPECRDVIVKKLKSAKFNPGNATSTEIFNELVAEPLRQLTASNSKISYGQLPVVIIDALDECTGVGSSNWKLREDILKCFSTWAELAPGVKLIVTSRAERDIKQAFEGFKHTSREILAGSSVTETSTHDIELYMKDEFKKIAAVNEISEDWPGKETIKNLSRRAEGVFIWATTVLAIVNRDGVDPKDQLNRILNGRLPAGNVYGLYRQILDTSFPHMDNPETFILVVGAIVALQQLFTSTQLGQLLGIDVSAINSILKGLQIVLDEGKVIRFRHQSFVDFLTDDNLKPTGTRPDDLTACPERFHINISDAHGRLCESLFRLMNKELRFNICNIPSSFLRNDELEKNHIEDAIGLPLEYACRFWRFHLSNTQSGPELNLVKTFLHEHLLSWLECLSLLQYLNIAAPSLESLQVSFSSLPEQPAELVTLVKDAIKFIRYFAQAIAVSAPHIYTSALTFAPKTSVIAQLYSHKFKNIMRVEVGQTDGWPVELAVIRSHSEIVNFIAFSPDGKRLVLCSSLALSRDKSVQFCDVETGQIVAGPFIGHEGPVICAVFSTDGKNIHSVSQDNTIRTWGANCGLVVNQSVEHVTAPVATIGFVVAFSHSRRFIASTQSQYVTSSGRTVQSVIIVRNVDTGKVVAHQLVRHQDQINCIAFSPDDMHVASGSSDGTVCIWNWQTGKLVAGPLEGHMAGVSSISYSHGGAFVLSGSYDQTIRLWDVRNTPHQVHVYKGHMGQVNCVAFSSDDRWIVSGSNDGTVRIWDVHSEQVVAGPFQGHTERIISVAFSPDGKRVASASWDKTVRIWDVDVEVDVTSGGLKDSHERGFDFRAFGLSNDGRNIVSGSEDGTIRIWDLETGQLSGRPFKMCHSVVSSVAYSPDSKRVVSGSYDGRVYVWDIATREVVMELRDHKQRVDSVAYSNNGRYIASTSRDDTNRIWNAETGECIHTWNVVRAFASIEFSPDDKLVVTNSNDGFGIWNVETGELVIKVAVPRYVFTVTFSHDGKLVATGSNDGTVRMWNATTGQELLSLFTVHTGQVPSVAFSPDGKFIVSTSSSQRFDLRPSAGPIHVWDAKTGRIAMGPFNWHTDYTYSVSFTRDNKYIVSGSLDGTIRVWSTTQTQQSLFTDQSKIDRNGWVKGVDGELLFWVPPRHRTSLHRPSTIRIIGPNETRLDFENAHWGEEWALCHTP